MNNFTYILTFDPAINVAESDLVKYMNVERDPKHLKYIDGQSPMVWYCKRLSRDEIKAVRNAGSAFDSNEAAFKRGLSKVEKLIRPDGSVSDWYRQDGMAILKDDILDKTFSESMIQEVGSFIWQKSVLMPSSTTPYVLPATSVSEVKGLLRRNAENLETLSKSVQEKEKHKATPAKQSSQNGEEHMGAIAEEEKKPQQE